MSWLTVITAVISVLANIVGYLKDRQLIDAAKAEIIAAHLKGAVDEIEKSDAIAAAVERDFDADKLRQSDDPNRRD